MRKDLQKIQWCPGCGDFIIQMAIMQAFKELEIPSHKRVTVSGIGCSGKMSQYIDGYAAETLHGRSVPFATGIKMANPELTVLAVGGDGDGLGIGLSHFLHACRRNTDMTYIICNNENYGLTTGQSSPTTPQGAKTKTHPKGADIAPFDPINLANSAGATFAVTATSDDMQGLTNTIKEAIEHPGFAFVNVDQNCPTFRRW